MSPRRRIDLSCLVMAAMLLGALPAKAQPAITFEVANGNVTLKARNAPLSSVLTKLAQSGVKVITPDVPDRNVTISVSNQPLDVVLSRLLPTGTTYIVRTDRADLVIAGRSGEKSGRRTRPRTGLAAKSSTGTASGRPINPDLSRKTAEDVELPAPKLAETVKRPPTVGVVSESPGPKIARNKGEHGKYARFRFTMTPTSIAVQDGFILAGELIQDSALLGDYIYALQADGKVLAIGSFRDPLELHSYAREVTGEHKILTAKSGDFLVSLPERALDRAVLAASTLTIFRLTNTAPDADLTAENFGKFREVMKPVQTVSGQDLVKVLYR